jgi:hypothetical protein
MNPFTDLIPKSGGANPFMDLVPKDAFKASLSPQEKEKIRMDVSTNPRMAARGVADRALQMVPLVGTFVDDAASALEAVPALFTKDKEFGNEFKRNQEREKFLRNETKRQHPGAAFLGDAGGLLATLPAAPTVRAPATIANLLPAAGKGALEGVLTGGLYGAAAGLGEGDSLSERTQNAQDLASWGALGGGVLGTASGALAGRAQAGKGVSRLSSDDVRKLAGGFYDDAERAGGNLSPSFTNKFIEKVRGLSDQTPEERIFSGPTEFSKQVRRTEFLKDRPLSLKAAQGIDKNLTEQVSGYVKEGKLTGPGLRFKETQNILRDMIREAGPGEITGGTKGFEALDKGRKAWAQSQKLSRVERIVERTKNMDQPAKALASGFNTLKNNPSKMRGFSEAEKKAIDKAAKTGLGVDALRVLGSRLGPIGASVAGGTVGAAGGPIGSFLGATASGLASHALSSTARKAAEKLQMKKANRVIQEILKGVPAVQNNIPQQVMRAPQGILGPSMLQYLGPLSPQFKVPQMLRGG